jgi:hypothetical protein
MTSKRRSIPLALVRADGWLERLGEGSTDFDALREVIGERFIAFAFIAGVRVTALTLDRQAPDATLVDFVVGEDEAEQRLSLGEFRRRLVAAILADDDDLENDLPSGDVDVPMVHAFIGIRYVLLAPVFGISLAELRVGGSQGPTVMVDLAAGRQEISLWDLRETIREHVRLELRRVRTASPFAIDLAALPDAEEALSRGDHETTIELLGAWPGPLSMLLRTPEGQHLGPEVRSTLANALGVLGSAYVAAHRFEWAEEVMRLGIQWGQDGPAAAELFRRLGDSYVERGRHGEAIGLLRRAVTLGAQEYEVAPQLARCYAARERFVAAVLCAEEAIALGVEVESMQEIRDKAMDVLGDAWTTFRDVVPVASTTTSTAPPPREDE